MNTSSGSTNSYQRFKIFTGAVACGLLAIAGTGISHAGTIALVDFDPPSVAQGPSIYVAVPGPQTIVTTPATFSGGVALGFATFFPAISFATAPNVYGTADFGNNLSNTLNIDIDPAFATTEVSFALFNGETFNQSYTVDAFDGAGLVASQTLTNIAPNFNSGYGLFDLTNPGGITSLVIAPTGAPTTWDFLIDSAGFNENIINGVNPPPPPSFQPPAPPVQGHLHGHGEGETELVEVNFGDDVNNIRGTVLLVTNLTLTSTPEPQAYMLALSGLLCLVPFLRKRRAA
jgi:hypothetical protein